MLATERQPKRAYEELRHALVNYHGIRQGERQAPEDVLLIQRTPIEEANFTREVERRVDVETALLNCSASFSEKLITWQHLTNGGTWRARVGRDWSMGETAVSRIADRTLWRMVEYLTGKRGGDAQQ